LQRRSLHPPKLIVHRDIKPANILVTPAGSPKLPDVGIAKLLAPASSPAAPLLTAAEVTPMTPDYASPEQVTGALISTATTDVYSLGAVLYELLTNRRPHQLTTYESRRIPLGDL
jgi:serine/threonine protein kinase